MLGYVHPFHSTSRNTHPFISGSVHVLMTDITSGFKGGERPRGSKPTVNYIYMCRSKVYAANRVEISAKYLSSLLKGMKCEMSSQNNYDTNAGIYTTIQKFKYPCFLCFSRHILFSSNYCLHMLHFTHIKRYFHLNIFFN